MLVRGRGRRRRRVRYALLGGAVRLEHRARELRRLLWSGGGGQAHGARGERAERTRLPVVRRLWDPIVLRRGQPRQHSLPRDDAEPVQRRQGRVLKRALVLR